MTAVWAVNKRCRCRFSQWSLESLASIMVWSIFVFWCIVCALVDLVVSLISTGACRAAAHWGVIRGTLRTCMSPWDVPLPQQWYQAPAERFLGYFWNCLHASYLCISPSLSLLHPQFSSAKTTSPSLLLLWLIHIKALDQNHLWSEPRSWVEQ